MTDGSRCHVRTHQSHLSTTAAPQVGRGDASELAITHAVQPKRSQEGTPMDHGASCGHFRHMGTVLGSLCSQLPAVAARLFLNRLFLLFIVPAPVPVRGRQKRAW